jgi:hypothetical protein
MAAGASSELKKGLSFTVHYNMKQLFTSTPATFNALMSIRPYAVFRAAEASTGLQADSQPIIRIVLLTVRSHIHQQNNDDADVKKLIEKRYRYAGQAWTWLKPIFDWQPKPDDPAKASAGACGGVAVKLKFNYQKRGIR